MTWYLLWGAWALAVLAVYRACDLALRLYLKRRRQRHLDRELAAERERQRLIALAGLTPTPRRTIRMHVPVETVRRRRQG
jgi:hypothetical protein